MLPSDVRYSITKAMSLWIARVLERTWAGHLDRWDLLESSAFDAPVLLPARFRTLVLNSRVGLPPGHLW